MVLIEKRPVFDSRCLDDPVRVVLNGEEWSIESEAQKRDGDEFNPRSWLHEVEMDRGELHNADNVTALFSIHHCLTHRAAATISARDRAPTRRREATPGAPASETVHRRRHETRRGI